MTQCNCASCGGKMNLITEEVTYVESEDDSDKKTVTRKEKNDVWVCESCGSRQKQFLD